MAHRREDGRGRGVRTPEGATPFGLGHRHFLQRKEISSALLDIPGMKTLQNTTKVGWRVVMLGSRPSQRPYEFQLLHSRPDWSLSKTEKQGEYCYPSGTHCHSSARTYVTSSTSAFSNLEVPNTHMSSHLFHSVQFLVDGSFSDIRGLRVHCVGHRSGGGMV